jgi:hypothetical protein
MRERRKKAGRAWGSRTVRERRGGVGSCAVAMVREWQPSRVDRRVRATHPNTTSSALPFRGVVRSGGGAIVVLPEPAAGAAERRGAQLLKSREILCGTATGHALLERPRVETPHPRASSSLRATEDWLRRPTTQKAAPRTEKFGALIASSVSMCSALSSSASAAPLPLPHDADDETSAADAAADGVSIAALI